MTKKQKAKALALRFTKLRWNGPGSYRPTIVIAHQGFDLHYEGSKAEAEWFREQIGLALVNFLELNRLKRKPPS